MKICNVKITKTLQLEAALSEAKSKFWIAEKKDWDENNGTNQCTKKEGFFYHGIAWACYRVLNNDYKHHAVVYKRNQDRKAEAK